MKVVAPLVATERRNETNAPNDRTLAVFAVAVMLMAALPVVHADAPTEETTKLTASDGVAGDEFPKSLDASGDRIVVGKVNGLQGSAYVYTRNAFGLWDETKLLPTGAVAGDAVAWAVATDGDLVLVAAKNTDVSGDLDGAVYLYQPDAAGWTETLISASDGQNDDFFGISVAADAGRFVVGAFGDDDLGNAAGSAYLFESDGHGGWSETKFTASDGDPGDQFGQDVAISGNRIVVGAPFDEDVASSAGSVYVFEPNGNGGWAETKITASDGAVSDMFGEAVAVQGDRIVVGVHRDDDHGTNAGSVYIFEPDGNGGWTETKITASDAASADNFGRDVAVHGDVVLTGVRADDVGATNTGSAYYYQADGAGGWQETKVTSSDAAAWDLFGGPVALTHSFAAIGATGADPAGAVYVLEPPTSPPEVPQDDGGTGGDASDDPNDPTPVATGTTAFGLNGTLLPSNDTTDAYSLRFGTSADEFHMNVTPPAWADIDVRLISPSGVDHISDSGKMGEIEAVSITGTDMESGVWTFVFTLRDVDASRTGTPGLDLLQNDLVHYQSAGRCNPQCRP